MTHYFGLDPDGVAARIHSASDGVRVPTLWLSVVWGAVGFGLVSVGVYATVAYCGPWMYRHLSELGAYVVWMAMFIVSAGAVLSPLVVGPDRLRRFCALFALAFFLYAGVWVGSYFSLRTPAGEWINAFLPTRNKSGEWLGSLLGPAVLGMTIANAFGARHYVRRVVMVLFVTHSAGYFIGDALHDNVAPPDGMLLWGVSYGLGFGCGLGYTLYACQQPIRELIRSSEPGNEPVTRGG